MEFNFQSHFAENWANLLINKKVIELYISNDKEFLRFKLDDSSVINVYCDAECCSKTWIESLLGVQQLLRGNSIINIEELELEDKNQVLDNWEVMKFYGYNIVTDQGKMLIDFRNSSNGYYLGQLGLYVENSYPMPDMPADEEFRLVTEDF